MVLKKGKTGAERRAHTGKTRLKTDFLTQNLNFFGKLLYRSKKRAEMKAMAENSMLRREVLRLKRQLVAEQNKVSALVQLGNQVLQEVF